MTARDLIIERARLNNWQVREYRDAVTVSKAGKSISVRFSKTGGVTRVSSRMAPVHGRDKLGQVLRLMGTLTIE